jgi:hypothetical protein
MIDLKRYYRLYPAGLCWVEKDPDGFMAKYKRFSTENGIELSPEYLHFTKEELLEAIGELHDKLDAADMILKDIENL